MDKFLEELNMDNPLNIELGEKNGKETKYSVYGVLVDGCTEELRIGFKWVVVEKEPQKNGLIMTTHQPTFKTT